MMTLTVDGGIGVNGPSRHWTPSERKQWLAALFLGCSSVYLTRSAMPLCIVSISQEFKWSKTDGGAVLSAFFWGYCMTQILGGYLSDRIGGDIVMVTAGVGWALLTFWTPVLPYLFHEKTSVLHALTLSRVLLGCMQGVHYPSVTSLVSQKVSESQKTISYAIATAGGQVGTLLTGWIGSHLLEAFGWHMPFYIIGLVGMAWVCYLRYYLIAKQRRKKTILSLKDDLSPQHSAAHTSVPWLALFSKPAFWAIIVGHFCQNWCFFLLLSWLPSYFHDTFPEEKSWIYNMVPWMSALPCVIFSGWLADALIHKGYSVTFVRKLSQTVCLLGYASCLFAVSLSSTFYGALFFMTLAIASSGFHNSGILVNPTDIAPKYAGSVFGVMNTAGAVPGFVGVYIAGYILEVTHSWSAVFNQAAVISILGWIVFLHFGTGKAIV